MKDAIKNLVKDTRSSAAHITKAALALPTNKRDWSPGGAARSAVNILKECATFPHWILATIEFGKMPEQDEAKKASEELVGGASTVESLTEILNRETDRLCAFMESFPESRMSEEMTFPWGKYSLLGVFGFHYWNNTYHLGQINYIQLLLGDTEMHV